MMHAIAYTFLGVVYMATLFGLDKAVAVTLHGMTYLAMGAGDFVAHTPNARVARWAAMAGLVLAFQTVEVGCAATGDDRAPIVVSAAVSPRAGRGA